MTSLDGWIGEQIPDVVMDDAAAWLVMLDSDDCHAADRIAFARWLDEDPMHQWAFEELSAVWARLRTLSDVNHPTNDPKVVALPTAEVTPATSGNEAIAYRRNGWSALAASLLIAAGIVAHVASGEPVEEYATGPAETRAVGLSDGTRLELNAGTTLHAVADEQRRTVRLLNGEAVFHIARDPRPFVVRAERGTIMATGTTFSVESGDDLMTVTVIEGQVSVNMRDGGPPQLTGFENGGHLQRENFAVLVAGEHLELPGDSTEYRVTTAADVNRELSWRQGWVVIDDQPLSAVLRKVRRYTGKNVFIADTWLSELHVSGRLTIGDVDGFLDHLSKTYGITVDRSDQHWIVLRAAPRVG